MQFGGGTARLTTALLVRSAEIPLEGREENEKELTNIKVDTLEAVTQFIRHGFLFSY